MNHRGKLFALIEEYNSRRSAKSKKSKKDLKASAKQFDTGEVIELSCDPERYEHAVTKSEVEPAFAFSPYIHEMQEEDGVYIESFSEHETKETKYEVGENAEDGETPIEREKPPFIEDQEQPQPYMADIPRSDEEPGEVKDSKPNTNIKKSSAKVAPTNQSKSATHLSDDELANDLSEILSMDETELTTPKETHASAPQKKQDTKKDREAEDILHQAEKNEHAIFDKIAQSMKYANAYDLGSFALENRLIEIEKDVMDEEKTQPPKHQVESPTAPKANITDIEPISPSDLLENLDEIKQKEESNKADPKTEEVKPEVETVAQA